MRNNTFFSGYKIHLGEKMGGGRGGILIYRGGQKRVFFRVSGGSGRGEKRLFRAVQGYPGLGRAREGLGRVLGGAKNGFSGVLGLSWAREGWGG